MKPAMRVLISRIKNNAALTFEGYLDIFVFPLGQ
jgi:hypothetical protein